MRTITMQGRIGMVSEKHTNVLAARAQRLFLKFSFAVHSCNSNSRAEARGCHELKPCWAVQEVPGELVVQSAALSQAHNLQEDAWLVSTKQARK